jgi:hypothetical protein
MLILKSFDMADEKGMNDILATSNLAEKSAVFVSNGRMVLQIEDGLPMTKEQKMVEIKAQINTKRSQLDIISHGERVRAIKIENVESQIKNLEEEIATPGDKKAYDKKKTNEAALKHLKAVLDNFKQQEVADKAEVDNINVEIEIYLETIEDLINNPGSEE